MEEIRVMARSSACQKRAAHRKAQAKYVSKAPKAQASRVKKSEQKAGKSGSPAGRGEHGSTMGRPRKAC